MSDKTFETRFRQKMDPSSIGSGCWTWTGSKTKDGYGKIRYNGRVEYAHRAIWMDRIGPIPDGLHILHSCDNPSCVRLDHLFLGTHQDNMTDCSVKGRMHRGEQHGMAKLTKAQVAEIRLRYLDAGISQKRLASEYGIDQSSVSRIIRGEQWAHRE